MTLHSILKEDRNLIIAARAIGFRFVSNVKILTRVKALIVSARQPVNELQAEVKAAKETSKEEKASVNLRKVEKILAYWENVVKAYETRSGVVPKKYTQRLW